MTPEAGLAAEYADEHALVAAIRALRARGIGPMEAYSPIPSHAIDKALGEPRSPLAIAAGIGAIAGAGGAYALQWLLVAYLYPVDTGGRPPHMPLPFTIITIEMGFLFAALATFVAFLVASRLVTLWHPMFEVPGFESATRDGWWLAVGTVDTTAEDVLRATEPLHVHRFGGWS